MMEKQFNILLAFQEKEWITKSGKKLKIKDLELSHLRNIVSYLKRKFDTLENPMNYYPSFQGEIAQMYAEEQWMASMDYYKRMEREIQLFECYLKLKLL